MLYNWCLHTIVVFERAPHAGLSMLISIHEQSMPVMPHAAYASRLLGIAKRQISKS